MSEFFKSRNVILIVSLFLSSFSLSSKANLLKLVKRGNTKERTAFIHSDEKFYKGKSPESMGELYDLRNHADELTKKIGSENAEKLIHDGALEMAVLEPRGKGGVMHFFSDFGDGRTGRFSYEIPKFDAPLKDTRIVVFGNSKPLLGAEIQLKRRYEAPADVVKTVNLGDRVVMDTVDKIGVAEINGKLFKARTSSEVRVGPGSEMDIKGQTVGIENKDSFSSPQRNVVVSKFMNRSKSDHSLAVGTLDVSKLEGVVIDSRISPDGKSIYLTTHEGYEYSYLVKEKPHVPGKSDELEFESLKKIKIPGGVESLYAEGNIRIPRTSMSPGRKIKFNVSPAAGK